MLNSSAPPERRVETYLRQMESLADVCEAVEGSVSGMVTYGDADGLSYWEMPSSELRALLLVGAQRNAPDAYAQLTPAWRQQVDAGVQRLIALRDLLAPYRSRATSDPRSLLYELFPDTSRNWGEMRIQPGDVRARMTHVGIEFTLEKDVYEDLFGRSSDGMNIGYTELPEHLKRHVMILKSTTDETRESDTSRHEKRHALFAMLFQGRVPQGTPPEAQAPLSEHRRYALQQLRKALEYARDELIAYGSKAPFARHHALGLKSYLPLEVPDMLRAAPDDESREEILACYSDARNRAVDDVSRMRWLVGRLHAHRDDDGGSASKRRLPYLLGLLSTRGRRWRHLGVACGFATPDAVDAQYQLEHDKLRTLYTTVLPQLLAENDGDLDTLLAGLRDAAWKRDISTAMSFPIGDVNLLVSLLCERAEEHVPDAQWARTVRLTSEIVLQHGEDLSATTIQSAYAFLRPLMHDPDRTIREPVCQAIYQVESNGYVLEKGLTREVFSLLVGAETRRDVLRLLELLPRGDAWFYTRLRPAQIEYLDPLRDGAALLKILEMSPEAGATTDAVDRVLLDGYMKLHRQSALRSGILMDDGFESSLRTLLMRRGSEAGMRVVTLIDDLHLTPMQQRLKRLGEALRPFMGWVTKVTTLPVSDIPPQSMA